MATATLAWCSMSVATLLITALSSTPAALLQSAAWQVSQFAHQLSCVGVEQRALRWSSSKCDPELRSLWVEAWAGTLLKVYKGSSTTRQGFSLASRILA